MTETVLDSDRQRIRDLHEGWVRANATGDIGWLRAHLGPDGRDDFVMWNTVGSNFFGLEAVVALWEELASMAGEAGAQQVVSEAWDERIQIDGDIAVVTCLCRLAVDFGPRGGEAGGKIDQVNRATEVYRRRGNDWKMIHYHGSPHTPGLLGGE